MNPVRIYKPQTYSFRKYNYTFSENFELLQIYYERYLNLILYIAIPF